MWDIEWVTRGKECRIGGQTNIHTYIHFDDKFTVFVNYSYKNGWRDILKSKKSGLLKNKNYFFMRWIAKTGTKFPCCWISLLFHVVIDRGLWFVIVRLKFQIQVHTIKQSHMFILIGWLTTVTTSRSYNMESKSQTLHMWNYIKVLSFVKITLSWLFGMPLDINQNLDLHKQFGNS